MPRKRSVLPQPCPLCGRTDGTYQFVIFNNKNITSRHAVICRIGHYDKNYYLKRQLEILSNNREKKAGPVPHLPPQLEKMLFPPHNILKTKKPCGKVWHCFKVDSSFLWITRDEMEVSLIEYFDASREDEESRKTSHTVSPTQEISELIKKEGWRMDKSLYMARRKVKEYSFPILLTKQNLLNEGERKWFAKRKKYRMSSEATK